MIFTKAGTGGYTLVVTASESGSRKPNFPQHHFIIVLIIFIIIMCPSIQSVYVYQK